VGRASRMAQMDIRKAVGLVTRLVSGMWTLLA
jgi:hypothetical protein